MENFESATILVVDDEEKMVHVIANFLEQEGYRVICAYKGEEALQRLREHPHVQLVLLDWMMPGKNGLDICQEIRSISEVPIIFLTAKSDEVDKLLGLEIGADDYMTKPFSMRELAARIRVVLRRYKKIQALLQDKPQVEKSTLQCKDIFIDLDRRLVKINGEEVSLTKTEFTLLTTLVSRPGQVFSRSQLVEIVYGSEYAGYERSIDTHVRNLRKKIEEDDAHPHYIQTVFGVGYKCGVET